MKAHRFVPLLIVVSALTARAAGPAVRWDFGQEETTPLVARGTVQRDVPGPRPPEFPDLEPGNLAVRLDGEGYFAFDGPLSGGPLTFTNGQSITLEAWVKVDELRAGESGYVIGKGRTWAKEFPRDNQNWALRVREGKGKACVNFLFATPPVSGTAKTDAHWHRWTSDDGFVPGSGWHHIAVAYRFGEPASIKGWIDGKPKPGRWDMGGATAEAPVTDDDAVWIGSAMKGNASNSFKGSLDAVAVHREILGDDVLLARFRREGPETVAKVAPEVMPELGPLPAGQVRATFHEGLASHLRWPEVGDPIPGETARWSGTDFLLPRLPRRYDAWGIREGWKAPVLTRLAADVTLPPGRHRFLIRARGLSRLWVDGRVVARTKPLAPTSDGHQPIPPLTVPPFPGVRPAGFDQQEAFGEADIPPGRPARVVLETMVGGKKFRAEPGELCVAVQGADGRSFAILGPDPRSASAIPLADAEIESALARIEASLLAHDDRARRAAAASQDPYWAGRHEKARAWAAEHPAPTPPPGDHPIDAFLAARIRQAVDESERSKGEESRKFQAEVLPVLRDQCFRCHGEKEKGGLKLNDRAAALKGGDSEQPAVVPGDPAASALIARIKSHDDGERMPPKGVGLSAAQVAALESWIQAGAPWPAPPVDPASVRTPPVVGDAAFLRRVTLDTVGVPPTEAEARSFVADASPDKRERAIDRLLADERTADHSVGYWQDVLAENPNMLKPSLNNTGPFRWFLHEALRDNKPMDRLVTELVLLKGSEREGGSAGFGLAADNDAPFAAKGHVVASAFLGIELQCARCHDSPYHSTKQRDLYALSALFERKPVTVPKTSTVPAAFFERKARESLIRVTLKPGEVIEPAWPFAKATGCADDASVRALMQSPDDPRERLAALITAPQDERFAQVIVNRIWRRLMGAGFVEPAHDWEGHPASHPDLIAWLAREFIAHEYDLRYLTRLILTSRAYQREAEGHNLAASPDRRFFAAPDRRRLSAEQVVDSLFFASGRPIEVEEITFDPDARRPPDSMISLGAPSRAWMFASLSNERDRPSLSLPRAQAVTDVLEAFGWSGSRQNPRTDRESDPNVLQPGILANGIVSTWVTRASAGGALADLAAEATSPEGLAESMFFRFLGRPPTPAERDAARSSLAEGFDDRLFPTSEVAALEPLPRLPRVTWSNHLVSEATTVKLEVEHRARVGPPADPRLRPEWRERFEDLAWTLIITREFVWMP
ncbi:DUF1553 domain-containing protein [Tundrisphaera sp. TA3]|uniref:DUF1553 domain-containing protein n=1 Tax=Tundrisphaera sp. TA3 TaxID=3435775 RepID=UPI003EB90E25